MSQPLAHMIVAGIVQSARNLAKRNRQRHEGWKPRPRGVKLTSKELLPFITKITSTHTKAPAKGQKRVQCVVKLLGVTKTMHLDVPTDFTI